MVLLLQAVCQKIGIDVADRLELNSKKHKFLISDFKEEQVGEPLSLSAIISN